jgi:hypothetical protein
MACPCKTKLTEEQKTLHNTTSGTSQIQNSVGEKAGQVSGGLSSTISKINNLITQLDPILDPDPPYASTLSSYGQALQAAGINSSSLNSLKNKVTSMKSSVDAMKTESERLTDPQTLMSTIGTMNFYGNIGCALGIEGLDVGMALGVVTSNGKTSISVAGNIQIDLDKLVGNISDSIDLNAAAGQLSAGMDSISSKINDSISTMNGLVSDGQAKVEEAKLKVAEFTQITFLSNLVGDSSDPCNKMAVESANNLLSPEFRGLSQSAISSVSSGLKTNAGDGFR